MSADAPRSIWKSRGKVLGAVTAGAVLWLAIWVFGEMVDDTPKGDFSAWDELIVRWVRGGADNSRGATAIAGFARAITVLGSVTGLAVVVASGLAWLAVRRRWRAALFLGVATGGAALAIALLKQHFMRTRPEVVPHLVEEGSWSFPSGHALGSAAIYVTLSVVIAARWRTRWGQMALIAAAFLLSFLIGVSRIYLGVHYPTDVLAGWSAGTAWAIVCSSALIGWEHAGARKI
jgi:undecaprenyl-diphosphatase